MRLIAFSILPHTVNFPWKRPGDYADFLCVAYGIRNYFMLLRIGGGGARGTVRVANT